MQIVIAWADKTALVPTGRHIMRDRNWFPEYIADWEGKAAMWKRCGTLSDLEKAKTHASKDGYLVFTFPKEEKDPLGSARKLAIEHYSK